MLQCQIASIDVLRRGGVIRGSEEIVYVVVGENGGSKAVQGAAAQVRYGRNCQDKGFLVLNTRAAQV